MSTLTQSYLDNADRFTEVVRAADDWSAQSPCPEWKASDVLDHVVGAQRDYLAKQGVDLGDLPDGDPAQAWRSHLDGVRAAIADESFAAREFDGYFGPTTVEELLANFYGFDMVVHRWDLGAAVGAPVTFTEEEMDLLETAMDGLGDMLYSEGVCAPALEVAEDTTRQQKLLGRLGRRG